MDCKDICELLIAYLDGEVTPEEKAYIEAHLPGCPQCHAEFEALSTTKDNLRVALESMAEEVTPSVQAWGKVRARLSTKGSWLDGLHRLFTSGKAWQIATVTAAVVVIALVAVIWQLAGLGQAPPPAPMPAPAPAPAPPPPTIQIPPMTTPTPTPAPEPTPPPMPVPAPLPAPPPPFAVGVVPEEAQYLPGEPIEVELSLGNISSDPITLDPYPPQIQVKPQNQDEVVFSVAAGSQALEIKPGDTITLDFTWDQKGTEGNQVSPGWYNIIFGDITVRQGNSGYTFNPGAHVLVQYPQGAMEKTIELNQSQTVDGITVILERIVLMDEGSAFYVFFIPPGYTPAPPLAPGVQPPPPGIIARAEYSVSGITWNAGLAGFGTRDDGMKLVWGGYPDENLEPVHGHADYLNPIPADAGELTFTITQLNDWEGPWEFRIPLE
jgi:hypothetical protein